VLDAGIFQHTGQLHAVICTTWITVFTYQSYFILTPKEMATPDGDLDLPQLLPLLSGGIDLRLVQKI